MAQLPADSSCAGCKLLLRILTSPLVARPLEGPTRGTPLTPAADNLERPEAEAAAGIAGWRVRLLQSALAASAAALLLGALVYGLTVPAPLLPTLVITAGAGVFHLGLLRWRRAPLQLKSVLFVSTLAATYVALALGFGWAPVSVGTGVLALVAACLLLGRAGMVAIMLLTTATFWTGAWLVKAGLIHPEQEALLPTSFAHWLRVAFIFSLQSVALLIALSDLVAVLVRAADDRERAVAELRREQSRAGGHRARRLQTETDLHAARSLQTLGELGQGLAHRFNNLLTVARAALEELREASTEAELREAGDKLLAASSAAARPTADLLLFSRRTAPGAAPLPIAAAVESALPALRRELGHGLSLETDLRDPACVRLEADLVERLLLALVRNAAEAMPASGTISIRCDRAPAEATRGAVERLADGDYLALSVTDQGRGMDEETRRRACEPFFTSKGRDQHDGLGLSIALGIAGRAGGSMELRSAPGRGTTVVVFLPLQVENAETTAPDALAQPAPPPAGSAVPAPSGNAPAAAAPGFANAVANEIANDLATDFANAQPGGAPTAAGAAPWRQRALERILPSTLATVVGVVVLTLIFVPAQRAPVIAMSLPAIALMTAATLGRRLTNQWRLPMLLVALVGAAGAFLLRLSYLAPIPFALLLIGTVWSAMFGTRRTALLTLLSSVAWLIACGVIYTHTEVGLALDGLSLALPLNWVRVGLSLSIAFVPLGLSVFSVLESAELHLEGLQRSLAALEEARAAGEREHAGLLEAAQRLRQGARLATVAQVAGGVAAELQEAIDVLVDFSSAVVRTPPQPGEMLVRRLPELEAALENAEALVTQLGGESTSRPAPLDLTTAVRGAARALVRRLPANVALAIELEPGAEGAAFARVHRGGLRRVLLSLASNAAEAMPSGGRLTLRLRSLPGEVAIEVEDSGAGMSDEIQRRAFEPFFTTKAAGPAVGLGLHAARRLVEANQGTISLWSQPGIGSRFALRWPACEAPPIAAPLAAPVDASGTLVLLAEDEDAVRRLMVRALQKAGFEVVAVANGDEALAAIRSGRPWRALCTDAVMPGCPTAQLVDEFHARHPGRPVLLCSGYSPEMLAEQTWRPQVSFLAKPFSPKQLSGTLLEVLSGRGPLPHA